MLLNREYMDPAIRVTAAVTLNIGNDSTRAIPNSFQEPRRLVPLVSRMEAYDVNPDPAMASAMYLKVGTHAEIAKQVITA